eukprot:m51a1_g12403 hypothetical protein (542) ;mRNA; r:691229-693142
MYSWNTPVARKTRPVFAPSPIDRVPAPSRADPPPTPTHAFARPSAAAAAAPEPPEPAEAVMAAPKSEPQECGVRKFEEIDPGDFYGPNTPLWEAQLALLQANPAPAIGVPDPWSSAPFQVFCRQQQAIECADTHNAAVASAAGSPKARPDQQLRVFSFEPTEAAPGKTQPQPQQPQQNRLFIATTYSELWRRSESMKAADRHFYELIRDGDPCRLYLDVEYMKADNPGLDGERALAALLRACELKLCALFRASVVAVVDLDSTTDAKFSRHIVVHLDSGTAFANNAEAGLFVKQVAAEAHQEGNTDLFARDEHGAPKFIADLGVYSRNRNFRMYKSTKAGKLSFLLPTEDTRELFPIDQDLFLASLVCNVASGAHLLSSAVARPAQEPSQRFAAPLAVAPGQRRDVGTPSSTQYGRAMGGASQAPGAQGSARGMFPALDTFMAEVARTRGAERGAKPGHVREAWYYRDTSTIVYSIADNHYCERIGRSHKSNNVLIVCNLQSLSYYQKCLDPDCEGFRSREVPLPAQVAGSVNLEQPASTV